jgi:hypothetical protein
MRLSARTGTALTVVAAVVLLFALHEQRPASDRGGRGSPSKGAAASLLLPTAPFVARRQSRQQLAVQAAVDRPSLLMLEQALNAGSETERADALSRMLPPLVAEDAPAVARFAELYIGADRELLIRRTSQLWAAMSATAALQWAETLASDAERDATITDVCAELANSNPARAVELRAQYPASTVESDAALENFMQQWAAKDSQAALDWTLARPEGRQRDLLLERIAFVKAQSAPQEAARFVLDQMPTGKAQSDAVITVLHQWALRDLPAATEWASRFPDDALKTRAADELTAVAQVLP